MMSSPTLLILMRAHEGMRSARRMAFMQRPQNSEFMEISANGLLCAFSDKKIYMFMIFLK